MSARTTATTARVERPAIPVPRDGWVQVANAFIDAAPLDNERLAHIILMSYAWDEEACHPYQEELAARLGVSVRTIKRRVGELRAAALVTVERGGGQDHPNVYHLHVRPVRGDDEGAVRFHHGPASRPGRRDALTGGQAGVHRAVPPRRRERVVPVQPHDPR